ncbi:MULTISPECIES: polyprenyl synthetase family protein [unclassified Nocardia]|uniref:polyprenyl synthetase family protein n=1 Tax=Nocardia sp. NPDC056064 TaxID=3345701 RepID=UPI0035DF3F6A
MDNHALPSEPREHSGEQVAVIARPSPQDQLPLVTARLREILLTGADFDAIYRHILAAPGKRVRARLVLASAGLLPEAGQAATSPADAVDLACAMEMFHESSLVHDDICDGSLLRRGAPSVPAAFGVRISARAGFHLAGAGLQVVARVLADNPVVFAGVGQAPGITYADRLSDLSYGQLIETLPPAVDQAALRRHYETVAAAKTGTLFRLSCSYGGTAGGVEIERLHALMEYADQLAMAFQIMDDVRDIEGGPALGKDAGGDLERRVPTWPVIEWLGLRPGAEQLWLDPATPSTTLQDDLVDSGATQAARSVAISAVETASKALEVFPPSPAREDLRELLQEVISR